MDFPYHVVDVFTAEPYRGNPVAVIDCLDGDHAPSTDEMQRIAHWTNLSETTFLLPPSEHGADYRVRIFTPSVELPFAGHPTLGTCHVWRDTAGHHGDRVVQQCGAGLIDLRMEDDRLAFAAPPLLRSGPVDPDLVAEIVEVLGVDPAAVIDSAWIDNGPGWVGLRFATADEVLAITPAPSGHDIGVVGHHPPGSDVAIEVRAFFPVGGATREDPVTGSLNASLAMWLTETGVVDAPYAARQGTALGRDGRVHVDRADGHLWIGGDTVTCVTGTIVL